MKDKDNTSGTYEVGYKKPPRHTRFSKGISGNPRGRPKGTQNLVSVINDLLDRPVTVVIEGVKQEMSGRNALAFKIFEKALKGDTRAIEILRETDREVSQALLREQDRVNSPTDSTYSDKEIIKHFLLGQKKNGGSDAK